jgi:RimJ/RimL family protein N-acetyltransferase
MWEIGSTRLRPFREADATFLGKMRNDLRLQRSLAARPRPNDAARVRAWIERASNDPSGVFFVVAERETDAGVGFAQLKAIDEVSRHAMLAIAIDEGARGRGHGKAAIEALSEYGRATFGLRKLVLEVLSDNAPALALYARTGFSRIGVLTEHYYYAGAFIDVVIMEKRLGGEGGRQEGAR